MWVLARLCIFSKGGARKNLTRQLLLSNHKLSEKLLSLVPSMACLAYNFNLFPWYFCRLLGKKTHRIHIITTRKSFFSRFSHCYRSRHSTSNNNHNSYNDDNEANNHYDYYADNTNDSANNLWFQKRYGFPRMFAVRGSEPEHSYICLRIRASKAIKRKGWTGCRDSGRKKSLQFHFIFDVWTEVCIRDGKKNLFANPIEFESATKRMKWGGKKGERWKASLEIEEWIFQMIRVPNHLFHFGIEWMAKWYTRLSTC